jgi:hypothetical protein
MRLELLRFLDVAARPTTPPTAAPRPAADCRLTAWAPMTIPVWTDMDWPDRWAEAVAAKSSDISVMATEIISLLIRMFMSISLIGLLNKSVLLTMEFNVADVGQSGVHFNIGSQ